MLRNPGKLKDVTPTECHCSSSSDCTEACAFLWKHIEFQGKSEGIALADGRGANEGKHDELCGLTKSI